MYPHTHFLAGLTIGLVGNKIGYFNIPESVALASLATLIDTDHYLYYSYKFKTLSFKKAWEAAVLNHEINERTAVHHALGFLIFTICLLLIFFIDQKWAMLLGLAYYSHILLDYLRPNKRSVKFKIWNLDFHLSYVELGLDAICFIIVFLLML